MAKKQIVMSSQHLLDILQSRFEVRDVFFLHDHVRRCFSRLVLAVESEVLTQRAFWSLTIAARFSSSAYTCVVRLDASARFHLCPTMRTYKRYKQEPRGDVLKAARRSRHQLPYLHLERLQENS